MKSCANTESYNQRENRGDVKTGLLFLMIFRIQKGYNLAFLTRKSYICTTIIVL